MAGENRAVIDVGTNSVKLLVANVAGRVVLPLYETSHQTRLGQGFYETRILQGDAIDQTAKAVANFVAETRRWNSASVRVIATSAARDALNKDSLIMALEQASGLPVTIISGQQEANWAYEGVATDPQLAGQNLLVMDVGGGSTEFILGTAGQSVFARSYPVGTVRLLEDITISDPPAADQLRQCEERVRGIVAGQVQPQLEPHLRAIGTVQLVATGGTSTILARIRQSLTTFDRALIEGTLISRNLLETEKLRLWSMALEDRRKVIGLPPNRADVILAGVVIFDQVLRVLNLPALRVSTRGLRFAALLDH